MARTQQKKKGEGRRGGRTDSWPGKSQEPIPVEKTKAAKGNVGGGGRESRGER